MNFSALRLVCLVFGFVCFVLSAFGVQTPPRINLIAAGLAFWIATLFLV